MKKRIFVLFISVLISMLTIGSISVSAYYSGLQYNDYLYYKEYNGKITISDCDQTATEIEIPSEIQGMPVTSIGVSAFYGCRSLTSISIPDSVTSIDDQAFYGCSGLTSVTLPDSVTSIGDHAFYECSSLTSISIPDGVTSISNNAFRGCSSLTSISIPDGVTSISNNAFCGCSSLTDIFIPDSVTSIGDYAFSYCSSLTSVTIPDGVTSIGNYAFSLCSSLTSVTLPDCVTHFGNYAFSGCSNLISISIPSGVTSIDDQAFYGCSGLTSVTLPDSVTSISSGAFYSCSSLTNISVSDKNEYYSSFDGNLYNKDHTSILVCPPGKTEITIPDGVTSISNDAFSDCSSLTSITIPDGVTSIGNYAFSGCSSLTDISLPDSVTYIGNTAFQRCSFTSVTIPDGVTSISNDAFRGCSSLTDIFIPNGVTSIGTCAFYECDSLAIVHYNGTEAQWNAIKIVNDYNYNYRLQNARRVYFAYVTLIDEKGNVLSKDKYPINSYFDIFELDKKMGQAARLYTDREYSKEYDLSKTITENTVLYLQTIQYTIDDGSTITVRPFNTEAGNTVILALYKDNSFIGIQSETYNGNAVSFTIDQAYTDAKVMIWNSLDKTAPVCSSVMAL